MDSRFPRIFILPTRLDPDYLSELEEATQTLTYDICEAEVIVGRIATPQRALFELRRWQIEIEQPGSAEISAEPARKRQKPSGHEGQSAKTLSMGDVQATEDEEGGDRGRVMRVAKLEWLTRSLGEGRVVPLADYLLYEGRIVNKSSQDQAEEHSTQTTPLMPPRAITQSSEILARALADDTSPSQSRTKSPSSAWKSPERRRLDEKTHTRMQPPTFTHQSTSEHEFGESFPEIPTFLRTTYSCQRPTPVDTPNAAFIEQLKKIRTTRRLIGDEIGVRAYSTSIATLAAYPFPLTAPAELARLPGCGSKIAQLYQDWKSTGRLDEVEMTASDPKLSVLALFYDIWGVGDTTARDFYKRGWRDLDDVVEHGWNTLTRVQQIGVKYYDEFKRAIPRAEVKTIGATILERARALDSGFQLTIVGGYRRGKKASGDVDVVISHPREEATHKLVVRLVRCLEKTGHITHTLTLSEHNSERGQVPVSWKGEGGRGSGFDTLDKALVVWQEPAAAADESTPRSRSQPESASQERIEEGVAETDEAGADRPHRRVDIIVSPWKTVGCALLGWSGGTTFQRDLRRYCKKERGLKFDSSGIRSRSDGSWIDLERDGHGLGKQGPAPDMETAERRVFEGIGLEWRPPEERCTG